MMLPKNLSFKKRGFAVLGIVVALTILATMAISLTQLTATNQTTRMQEVYMDQAFLSNYATLEYSLRQIKVDGNPNPIPVRDLGGQTLSLSRYYNKIHAVTETGTATNTFSITDPNPPTQASCISINTASASYRGDLKQLIGITMQRNILACPMPVVMVGMVISWTPNANEKVTAIEFKFSAEKEWHKPTGQLSGTTFNFSNYFTFDDDTVEELEDIQWKTNIATGASFTLTFIFSDASKITVSF